MIRVRQTAGLAALISGLAILALDLPLRADQVIMKDGTVYKGKIMLDSDKAVLIGNPPFDPNSYYLQTEDIDKIIYEEYKPNAPAERKRGFTLETRLTGNVFSSDQLSAHPAAGIYGGLGFRVHPMLELNGGVDWIPAMSSKDGFSVTDGTTTRNYEKFGQYTAVFSARLYPFYKRTWKTEPYIAAGYGWGREMLSGSGDVLKGAGWHVGFGAIRPIRRHLFLEGRFQIQKLSYDTISFLGHDGGLSPDVGQQTYSLSGGISYRL